MSRSLNQALTSVGLGALALRLILFASAGQPSRLMIEDDSREYWRLGVNLAAGKEFSQAETAPYESDLRRTPVYPAFVAVPLLLSSGSVRVASLFGIVASVATVVLIVKLTIVLFGPRAGMWAGGWLALDLTSAAYASQLLTETLFTLLLMASVAAMTMAADTDRVDAVESGVLAGLAALCRPIGMFASLALWPAALWRARHRSASLLLIAVAVSALFVAAWAWRNARVSGVATVSSIAATNTYFHRAAYVQSYLTREPVDQVRHEWAREFDARSANWTERDRMQWLGSHGRSVVIGHPIAYAIVWGRGILRMLRPDEVVLPELVRAELHPTSWRVVQAVAWIQLIACYALALRGAVVGMRSTRLAAAIPLALIGYFLVVSGPEMYPRFRVPLMPAICMLAGVGMTSARKGARA